MKVTAITRYKQGDLFNLLQKVGWNQSDLARESGLIPTAIGGICNMKRRPTEKQANSIQRAFASVGEFFDVLECWPESFQGTGKSVIVSQTKEIDTDLLLESGHQLALGDRADTNLEELKLVVAERMNDLSYKERLIVEARAEGQTQVEIAKQMRLSPSRIGHILFRAYRKLRGPSSIEKIEKMEETLNVR